MINSTQAFQLAAALTPTFLQQVPPGSAEANALGMGFQMSQGGIQAELYKKALKKQDKGNGFIDTARNLLGAIPGPQQPFIQGANAVYDASQGNYEQALMQGVNAGMGFYDNFGGPAKSTPTPSYDPTTGMFAGPGAMPGASNTASMVPSNAVAAPDAAAKTIDLTSQPSPAPASGEKSADGGGGINPAVAAGLAVGGAALANRAIQNNETAQDKERALNESKQTPMHPSQRIALNAYAEMSPEQIRSLNPVQRMVMVGEMAKYGIPLSNDQARAIPRDERVTYQKQYPDTIPKTFGDRLHSMLTDYHDQYGSGRLLTLDNGVKFYTGF